LTVTRILVADDNLEFVEMVGAMLEQAGFDVVTATSGLAVAALIERERFDLMLLDVLMPGLSGDAIAALVGAPRPDLPVLLMTGESGGRFVPGTELPVLRKPFTEEQLVGAVTGLLGRRGGRAPS
jgi:DNA-binding response OmpR family regulator